MSHVWCATRLNWSRSNRLSFDIFIASRVDLSRLSTWNEFFNSHLVHQPHRRVLVMGQRCQNVLHVEIEDTRRTTPKSCSSHTEWQKWKHLYDYIGCVLHRDKCVLDVVVACESIATVVMVVVAEAVETVMFVESCDCCLFHFTFSHFFLLLLFAFLSKKNAISNWNWWLSNRVKCIAYKSRIDCGKRKQLTTRSLQIIIDGTGAQYLGKAWKLIVMPVAIEEFFRPSHFLGTLQSEEFLQVSWGLNLRNKKGRKRHVILADTIYIV